MFQIGADPEIFVKKGGKLIAATGLVPGDKKKPYKVEGGAVQVDGLLLEFNIDPVGQRDFATFNSRIVSVIRTLREMAKEIGGEDITLDISSWADFDPKYYEGLSDNQKELGCDPDFNGYTGEVNPSPNANTSRRGAAGHLHVGWGQDIPIDHPEHFENCCKMARILDRTVGMASIIINGDATRRAHYGAAGAFRPKPYGVEYRVPDNKWIGSKYERAFIFNVLSGTLNALGTGREDKMLDNWPDDYIREIINLGDKRPNYLSDARNILMSCLPNLAGYEPKYYKGW